MDIGAGEQVDRAVGALVGLAVGDAVGTTLEFRTPGSFTPITDLVGGGPFHLQAGQWTDDTSMALCLAESLLDTGGMDLADQLRRYLLWKDEGYFSSTGTCFDIGNTTRQQLERFRRTGEPVDPHVDETSAANGSLMRLAGVPIRWSGDVIAAADLSAQSSRSTHPAQRPVDACRLMGAMLAALIQGRDFDDVTAPGFWTETPLHPAVQAIADGSWRAKEPPAIRGTGYCIDALEASIWAVGGAGSYRDAVLRAANLGDDADTTAAITGQIAGARWGSSGIPAEWVAKTTAAERITSLAVNLAGDREPWRFDRTQHAWWVEPRLLAGEYPGSRDVSVTQDKLALLLDAGIRTFIDLTEPGEHGLVPYEPVLQETVVRRGLTFRRVSFPIPDEGVVADERYDEVLAEVDAGLARGGVFVHCYGGVGRTGTVVGCRLAGQGLDALQLLKDLRRDTRKGHRPAPETDAQRVVIRRRTRLG